MQQKWGNCNSDCYTGILAILKGFLCNFKQILDLLLNGTEHCAINATCSNDDNAEYGFSCSCHTGYTQHRVNYGDYLFYRLSNHLTLCRL